MWASSFTRWVKGRPLLRKHQLAKMLGHVIGISVHDTRRLPAEEAPPGIGTFAFDAVQIHAPARAHFDGLRADRCERDAGGGVPDVRLLVDTRSRLPAGAPIPVIALAAEVD